MAVGTGAGTEAVDKRGRFGQGFEQGAGAGAIPIEGVRGEDFAGWLAQQDGPTQAFVAAMNFSSKTDDAGGKHLVIPGADMKVSKVVVIVGDSDGYGDFYSFAALPSSLPKSAGTYKFASLAGVDPDKAALAWALGCYSYNRYKSKKPENGDDADAGATAKLVWPEGCNAAAVMSTAEATFLCRDLITTPAEDCAPGDLQDAAAALVALHGGASSAIVGDDLLVQNYPQVHAVGRGAAPGKHAPRVIKMTWGDASDPTVVLVGKGVTFDTGGLDIKPAAGMRQMKKDMGGSAIVLGLAHMIMSAKLKVNLVVIISAVENAISANAFRPGDVLTARNGLTSEIGNTDAEGRLVLADALVHACELSPALVIDAATLTGAARVALGTDVPVVFVNDEAIASALGELSAIEDDMVWRLPLFKGYAKKLSSKVADMNNIAEGGYGGAITAALYLEKFVAKGTKWVHMDVMAYNTASRPGRPEGGEAMGMRALYKLVEARKW